MLDEASARVMVARESFSTSVVGRVGVEVEWPVADANGARPSHRQLLESLCTPTALPYGSRVSLEPGGQVEVSSAPSESLAACIRAAMADVDCLRARARAAELIMMDSAFDLREPRRVVNSRWYTALERQYAQFGPEGYAFICNAASVQVNVDAGAPVAGYAGREHRWWLANQLGPMLTALFANSPAPSPNGAVTLRQLTRFRTDPSRTDPPVGVGSGMDTWTDYVLNARIVAISDLDTGELRDPPLNWTLRTWLHSSEPRPVTIDDVRRHMKSVIPPVRACGRLELRMIDTQPGDDWLVPLIVVSTLLDDPSACQEISELAHEMPDPPLRRHYIAAARDGLRLPELAGWARQSFEIVTNAVAGAGLPRKALAVLESFAERIGYTDSSVQFGAGVGARDAA